jgi:hypothetical protein
MAIRKSWAAAAMLPVMLLTWHLAGNAADKVMPAYSVTVSSPDGRSQVTYVLYALPGIFAEYRRMLHFSGPGGSASVEPMEDMGGYTRMGLYVTPSQDIVIVGGAGEEFYFEAGEGKAFRLSGRVEAPLTYLGALDFARKPHTRELRLIRPDEQPECIATGAEWAKPGPNRPEAHRVTCPGFRPTQQPG